MMTTEGWVDTMTNGIDATGIEQQPKKNNNPYMAIYFVIFMIFGCFLLINLFTAVITDNFNKIKEHQEIGAGEAVNEMQKQFVEVNNVALKIKPFRKAKAPISTFRKYVYLLVTSSMFDLIVIIAIILNTIVIAMTYARMSDSYALSIVIMNYIFVLFYNVEFVLKIIGLGKQYFTHDSWNIFDFI